MISNCRSRVTDALREADITGYADVYQAVVTGNRKNQAYQFTVGGTAVHEPYARMVNPSSTQGLVVQS